MNSLSSSKPPSFGRLFMAGPRPAMPKVRVAADGSVSVVERPMDFAGLDLVKFYLQTPPGKGGANVGLRWAYLDRFAGALRLKRADASVGNFRNGRSHTSPWFFLRLGWSPDPRRLPPEGGHHMLALRPSDFDTAGDLLRFLRRLVIGWDPACTYISELHVCLNGTARFMETLQRVDVANVRNIYPWDPEEIKVSVDDEGPGPPSIYDFVGSRKGREYELHSSTVYFGGRKSLLVFYDKDLHMREKHGVSLGGGPLTRIEERRKGRKHLGPIRTLVDLAGFKPSTWFQRLRGVNFKSPSGDPRALKDLRIHAKEVGHTMAVAMQRHHRNLGRDIAPWVEYPSVAPWLDAADADLKAFWRRAPLAPTPTRKADIKGIAEELAERLRVDAKKATKASNGALAAALLHGVRASKLPQGSRALAEDLLKLYGREGGLSCGKCLMALNLYEAAGNPFLQPIFREALVSVAARRDDLEENEAKFIDNCVALEEAGRPLSPPQRDFISDLWDRLYQPHRRGPQDGLSSFGEEILDLLERETGRLTHKIPFVPANRQYLTHDLLRLLLRLEAADPDLGLLSQWLSGYVGRSRSRRGLEDRLNSLPTARRYNLSVEVLAAILVEKARAGDFRYRPRLASDDL